MVFAGIQINYVKHIRIGNQIKKYQTSKQAIENFHENSKGEHRILCIHTNLSAARAKHNA